VVLDSKSRYGRPAWSIALVLAFAVSIWGLHYKLSLYHPPAAHAGRPEAKLLSQKERPAAATRVEQLAAGNSADIPYHPAAAHTLALWALATVAQNALDGKPFHISEVRLHPLDLPPIRPSAPRPPPATV